jgi:hypothetical protein
MMEELSGDLALCLVHVRQNFGHVRYFLHLMKDRDVSRLVLLAMARELHGVDAEKLMQEALSHLSEAPLTEELLIKRAPSLELLAHYARRTHSPFLRPEAVPDAKLIKNLANLYLRQITQAYGQSDPPSRPTPYYEGNKYL